MDRSGPGSAEGRRAAAMGGVEGAPSQRRRAVKSELGLLGDHVEKSGEGSLGPPCSQARTLAHVHATEASVGPAPRQVPASRAGRSGSSQRSFRLCKRRLLVLPTSLWVALAVAPETSGSPGRRVASLPRGPVGFAECSLDGVANSLGSCGPQRGATAENSSEIHFRVR